MPGGYCCDLVVNANFAVFGTITKKKNIEFNYAGDLRTYSTMCSAAKKRGFGSESSKKKNSSGNIPKESIPGSSKTSKFTSGKPTFGSNKAPGLDAVFEDGSGRVVSDREFMEKLEAVRRSALAQKKAEAEKFTQAIDYDAPIEEDKNIIGFGTKVGVGVAVIVFGTVFAFGDFLPSVSEKSNEETQFVEEKLTDEEKYTLQNKLQKYEEVLSSSPDDLSAIEGSAVTLSELGEYKRASGLLEKLTKERPDNSEAYRLLGEVKYKLKDYVGSAESYKKSLSASGATNFEVLRGLTNALLAAEKPEEAVQVLLSYIKEPNDVNLDGPTTLKNLKDDQDVDMIQVQLLLGKAYSNWGRVSDAVAVYDQLISKHSTDFRGYLAKGIILKENGKASDAERMFIQARFFAPEKIKPLVDRYARN